MSIVSSAARVEVKRRVRRRSRCIMAGLISEDGIERRDCDDEGVGDMASRVISVLRSLRFPALDWSESLDFGNKERWGFCFVDGGIDDGAVLYFSQRLEVSEVADKLKVPV